MQRGKQPLWRRKLFDQAAETEAQFGGIMETYERSFQLFAHMMAREIEHEPDPDSVRTYLKGMDASLFNIVGETYDGLYMYYKGQYLYSWDTPYSVYEDSGYVVTERPWYQDAVAGKGEIVFTPPYMSYANHYILTTISQLQADGETVFAYDIKMEDIQNLVSSMEQFEQKQILIYDGAGTVVGSTVPGYLGGNLQRRRNGRGRGHRQSRRRCRGRGHGQVRRNCQSRRKTGLGRCISGVSPKAQRMGQGLR